MSKNIKKAMENEELSFEKALVRLQRIAVLVQKKDATLAQSLDLLEEGVYLANLCTEKIDQNIWQEYSAEEEETYG